jgi:hypothetical protein
VATATPGSLVRWHYLWYVAAALAVMIVAITSRHLWLLNFVHVFCSVLWTGIDLFMGFVLGPILRRLDIGARRDIARRLTPRTLFPSMPGEARTRRRTCVRLGRCAPAIL